MLTFIKKIFLGQKKRYFTVTIVLAILFSCDFTLLTMLLSISSITDSLSAFIGSMTIIVMIIISFLLMMFINNFFIEEKADEFSMILLSGRNVLQIVLYIVMQFGTLFMITTLIGGIIGSFMTILLNYIFDLLKLSSLTNIHLIQVAFYYFCLVLVQLCFIFIIDFGKFMNIKFEIVEFMNHVSKNKTKVSFFSSFKVEKEEKHFPIGQFGIVLFSFFIIFTSIQHLLVIDETASLLLYFISSLLSEVLFIKYSIPLFYDVFHNTYLLKKPKLLLAINQLSHLLKVMSPLIFINTLLTPMLFFLISMPLLNPQLMRIMIICYFILLVMIIVCFVYRFSLYLPKKNRDIATLKAIGFQKKEINYIQCVEIILYLIFTVLFPFIIYSIVVYKGYMLFSLTKELVFLLISSYFVAYFFIGIYMFSQYNKLVKEVIRDVKYLNRSE